MFKNKYNFKKLTPVSDADIDVYKEAIDFVFTNEDIKNVAISGTYSSGKSSIIESYKAKHKEKNFIHISLAYFRTPEQESLNEDETVKESVLEGKILNQLIHQIPADKIPQTNFRVKKGVDSKNLVKLTVLACLFFGSITFLLLAEKISSYVLALPDGVIKTSLTPLASQYAIVPFTFIFLICSIFLIFSIIKAQKNKNVFRKINLQGNEIEIFEEQDDSYFDKYLNEVLYLFENVEADVIVFEDMDRFNTKRIFERLREVNTLVNIQLKKRGGSKSAPLRFFYLIRDDIFISKDRTKFFDYIIPIIPIIDSSNSYEQFIKHLREGELLEKFDQSFLQGLSLYIDDMRILKNIYNEFLVYFNRLNITDLDYNKMMAIVAYKNIFPRDFGNLQIGQGFVYEVISRQKWRLIDNQISSLQRDQKDQKNWIETVKKEELNTQQELHDVYEAKVKRIPRDGYGRLTSDNQKLIEQNNGEFEIRKQAIQDKIDSNLPKLEAKLAQINHDIILTRSKSVSDLITRENIDSVFALNHENEIGEINEFKEIKGSIYVELLKYLIRNGFIDENYADYMTYFYDENISTNDKIFLRRVTDRRGSDYSYALKDPKKVIESPILRQVDFKQEEILNFDLLESLLYNHEYPKYGLYLKTLISQIQAYENFEFISEYYETGKERKNFVIKINELWPEFFSASIEGKALPGNQIRDFSIDTLYFSDNKSIEEVNIDNCLTEYISQSSDYLEIEQPNIQKLISGFSHIGVSFVSLNYEQSDELLFKEVYLNDLYELNFENIALMLREEYLIKNNDDIIHKNYTLVQRKSDSPLAIYISENMESYIDIVLENCDGRISDDEDIVISVLNNTDIDSSQKDQYINLLTTKIQDIIKVDEPTIWKKMLTAGIVEFSENNFVNYFIKHNMDNELINYLNDTIDEVDFSHTLDRFGEDVYEELFDSVAICNLIETQKYKKILNDLDYYFDNYEADQISDEKFEVLISEGILKMDVETLEYVRKKYVKHVFEFIEENLYEYLELQTVDIFNLDEVIQILLWDFSEEKKMDLISLTGESISVMDKGYSDNILAYLISHNHEPSDKTYLYANYSTFKSSTKAAIHALALSEVNTIVNEDITLDDDLLSIILTVESIAREHKIRLFTMALPEMSEDTCNKHFDELGLSNLKNIFTSGGSRRKYDKNSDVRLILDALISCGWIYDYKEDEKNNEKYRIIKNKPRGEDLIIG